MATSSEGGWTLTHSPIQTFEMVSLQWWIVEQIVYEWHGPLIHMYGATCWDIMCPTYNVIQTNSNYSTYVSRVMSSHTYHGGG